MYGSPPLYMTDDWNAVPVEDEERSLDVPTMRLEVTFH
jgi:hypothetical protein